MKEMKFRKINGNEYNMKVFEANFIERISGLMFKKNFNYGLLILNSNSIHTFFMCNDMDAIFLDKKNIIKNVYHSMKPWRMTKFNIGSKKVLELPSGIARKFDLKIGEQLEFSYV